jgi:rRNA large subunit m3Psi methyltransferase RlmH
VNFRFFRYCFLSKSNIPTSKTPENGATNQTWTDDRRFTKPMLYQLSYGGMWADCIKNELSCQKIFLYFRAWLLFYAVSDGHKHFDESIQLKNTMKRTQKFRHAQANQTHLTHQSWIHQSERETLLIIETLKKASGKVILLDERGKGISTTDMSEMLENSKNMSENITFVIGGSYGVDLELFRDIPHSTIKISDFVMPHSLALLVLIEQIYRAYEIMKWSGYHHS